MSEHEFIIQVNALVGKMQRMHRNMKWVIGIAVGIMVTFGGVFMVQGYSNTKDSTKALTSIEAINYKVDTQTITLGAEITERKLTEDAIKAEILRLEQKIDTNLKWLIENSSIKYRGTNPLLKQSNGGTPR